MTRVRTGGFTLIELLVVVSIIALLSSLVLASIAEARQNARNARMVAEINSVHKAIEAYRNENDGEIPAAGINDSLHDIDGNNEWQSTLEPSLKGGGYISSIPHPYNFPNNSDTGYSYWPNMSAGNWTCGGAQPAGYVLILYQDPPTLTQYPPLQHPSFGTFTVYRCIVY